MKRRKTICLSLALCAAVLFSGCSGAPASAGETVSTPVEVTAAAPGTIETDFTYTGQIKPAKQVNVIGKVSGKVETVDAEVGDRVAADDVLCTLDEEDIRKSIDLLRAQLESADAAVATARANLDNVDGAAMQAQISAAYSAMQRAELALSDAKTAFENAEALYEAGAASEMERTQAESAYKQAQIAYTQASETHSLLSTGTVEDNRRTAAGALNQALAARDAAAVQLKNAQDTLKDAAVRAPVAGTVTARGVEAGGMLSQAAPCFVIMELSTVTVNLNVSERNVASIREGAQTDVYVNALGPDAVKGTVRLVSPAADELKNTYLVKIELGNADGKLRPGMLAEARFVGERHENALVLPRGAVLGTGDATYVFVEENGAVTKVYVKTGIDNGKEIEITDGISEGARVVTKGQSFLNDGDAVNVVSGEVK